MQSNIMRHPVGATFRVADLLAVREADASSELVPDGVVLKPVIWTVDFDYLSTVMNSS